MRKGGRLQPGGITASEALEELWSAYRGESHHLATNDLGEYVMHDVAREIHEVLTKAASMWDANRAGAPIEKEAAIDAARKAAREGTE